VVNKEQIQALSKLPSPILSAYLRIVPDDASQHTLEPASLRWLRKEATSLAETLVSDQLALFRAQLDRALEFLRGRTLHEKSIIIFAGPEAWETVSLQVAVKSELHWGKPAISQLLWLAAEHRPYCIVAVDRAGVRFFSYQLKELRQVHETKFDVDISQWGRKDMGHVARPGIQKTYGSQRDVFDHRMEAQYQRICRETSRKAIQLYGQYHFSGIFLVGSERLIAPIASEFPAELQRHVVAIKKDLGNFDLRSLRTHIEPEIEKWEGEHEMAQVGDLLGEKHGAILGIGETLARLQNRELRALLLCSDFDPRLHRCSNCGWIDFSGDPFCSVCRGEWTDVTLCGVLPGLVVASEADVCIVSGEAATRLKEAGGIGAWVRLPKQRAIRRLIARAS